ncbi:MAG TPA: 3-phenylpropionate/cinnamic acid dioxygenase subunit beta [Solirubrobacteraceae bacterium]|nr:3-phenylpropionate/cinnamic acid dioxygenase subunit beta [Solirubrobacteraceae bacterium]
MGSAAETRIAIGSGDAVYHEVVDFLYAEAALLDDREHRAWLGTMTEDIHYVIPVRVTTAHSLEDSWLTDMAHLDEDFYSLTKRVERFETEHAWAEDPPSRTRRFITNIRCWRGAADDELLVDSSLLLFRSRGDTHDHDLVSCRRSDTLRRTGDGLRLAKRQVLLDESVVHMQNFAVFL